MVKDDDDRCEVDCSVNDRVIEAPFGKIRAWSEKEELARREVVLAILDEGLCREKDSSLAKEEEEVEGVKAASIGPE